MKNKISNLKINNSLLKAKKLGFTFALALTPITLAGCQNKVSNPTVVESINQNETNTYMGSVFALNNDLEKDVINLEQALSKNKNDEESRRYIMDNSKHILTYYLDYLIKSSMCETKNESLNKIEDYIINYQNDKYDGERITISHYDELYLVKDGLLKNLVKDYINVSKIDNKTSYNKIRNIAINSIEDSKKLINNYDIKMKNPSILTSYFDKEIDEEIITKRRKK